MNKTIISSHKAPNSRSMGPGVRQVIPSAVEHIDPFVFLDHFGPMERRPGAQGVPPHPHAGIATITYLFSGSNRHQDSLGNDVLVHSGDMAWMQAGKGIVHAEGMNENRSEPETVHGLQFWISLPAKDKFIDHAFYHHPSATLPTVQVQESRVKVLCGSLLGHSSPVSSLSPAYMYEIHIPQGQQLSLPIEEGNTAGLYLVEGAVVSEGRSLLPTSMTAYSTEGNSLTLHAQEASHLLLFGGQPLNEPIVGYASFVMNSEAQIRQVMQDYQQGRMGTIQD